jgi:hypothetical protein
MFFSPVLLARTNEHPFSVLRHGRQRGPFRRFVANPSDYNRFGNPERVCKGFDLIHRVASRSFFLRFFD